MNSVWRCTMRWHLYGRVHGGMRVHSGLIIGLIVSFGSYTKVLFLLVRYIPIFTISLMIYGECSNSWRSINADDSTDQISLNRTVRQCQIGFPALIWFVMFGIILAESKLLRSGLFYDLIISVQVILMIRTWAVWRRNAKVGIVLAALQLATLIASCYGNAKFVRALQSKLFDVPCFRMI